MKQTTKDVALDVQQAISVASVREEGGHVIARTILPTESTALVEFFGGMRVGPPAGTSHAIAASASIYRPRPASLRRR